MFMFSLLNEKAVKWKARDGFVCALVLIILSFIPNQILWFAYKNSPICSEWLNAHSNLTQGALMLIQSSLSLLAVFLFARTRSLQDFFAQVGASRHPTLSGWFAAWVAIGIGFLALYGSAKQWIPPDQLVRDFYYQGGAAKWFFIIYGVLVAPFSEEVVRRGFLYRAFRGSFKPLPSTCFVLCVHAYFHWGLISHSFYTLSCLILVEVLLCFIREWTGNLWNCVLCHAVYNATQDLPWYIYTIVLILLLPYCAYRAWPKAYPT
jgi:membrane protease YdiL (CAAX protease family)